MAEMLATPANMRKLNEGLEVRGARLMAYSPRTFEEYSADAGDYFMQPEHEPLRDARGEPMVLAFESTTITIVEDT